MSDASQAMTLAADYRREGYSPREALEMGWDEAQGGANPTESWGFSIPLLAAAVYGVWAIIKKS